MNESIARRKPVWLVSPAEHNRDTLVILGSLALLGFLLGIRSVFPSASSASLATFRQIVQTGHQAPSQAALDYWDSEIEPDRKSRVFLAQQVVERDNRRTALVAAAVARQAVRNDRSLGSSRPVTVYWVGPPWWWADHYGKGQGESMDLTQCQVACRLVSGKSKDLAQHRSHVVLSYNFDLYFTPAEGVTTADGKRLLRPWQTLMLYTEEPSAFTVDFMQFLPVSMSMAFETRSFC